MKKIWITSALCLVVAAGFAQNKNHGSADFSLGKGLDIKLNNGDYRFNIGGFVQPSTKLQRTGEATKYEHRFDINYAFFSLGGEAKKEKVSFLLQLDFANSSPLMDAWIAYQPIQRLKISAGQKQTFTNNREMMFLESNSSMIDRSILSQSFSRTGRELGLFVESHFEIGQVAILPQVAVTSGDGRNSFGFGISDVDQGGLKYGGRLDICPLGYFAPGNDLHGADLAHETTPKLKLGVAGSYNVGASESVGEGHGYFVSLKNINGQNALPDYRQIYVDAMFKYKGFSFLGEYVNATGNKVKGLFYKGLPLEPGQISSFLSLGDSYNLQAGYVLRNGFGLDLRYTEILPEFDRSKKIKDVTMEKGKEFTTLEKVKAYDATISKYFANNSVQLQAGVSYLDFAEKSIKNSIMYELLFQIVF